MCLVRIILLSLTILQVTVAQTNRWPYCENGGGVSNVVALGCMMSNTDPCVRQNDACKKIFCDEISQQNFNGCEFFCKDHPGFIEVGGVNGFTCTCMWKHNTLCQRSSPFTQSIETKREEAQADTPELIGFGMYKDSPEAGALIPVYCLGLENNCEKLPHICDTGPCLQDECYVEKYCYRLEKRENRSMECKRGKPAAIESKREYALLEEIANRSWTGFDSSHKIATAGKVRARTTTLIWDDWDVSTDAINEILMAAGIQINIQDYDQTLHMRIIITPEVYLQKEWDLNMRDNLEDTLWILCKTIAPIDTPGNCNQIDQYEELWNCYINTTCSHDCPLNATGTAYWRCGESYFTTEWPNYKDCRSAWVDNLNNMIEEGIEEPLQVFMTLDQFLDESSMFGHEMKTALNFTSVALDLLVTGQEGSNLSPDTKLSQREFYSELAIGVIDKILNLQRPWEQIENADKINTGINIQSLTEAYGFAISKQASEIGKLHNTSRISLNYHMEVQFAQEQKGLDNVQFPLFEELAKSSVQVSPKDRSEWKQIEAVGTFTPIQFAEKMFPPTVNIFADNNKHFNAEMVSMSLRGSYLKKTNLEQDLKVILNFKHAREAKGPTYAVVSHALYPDGKPTAIYGTAKCVFWNSEKGVDGEWDTDGCQLIQSSNWETTCECDHLSSFALIMDVHEYINKNRVLEILGIVFSAVSIICLAVTLLLLNVLSIKDNKQTSISKNLSLCLMSGHFLALIFMDKSYFNIPHEMCVLVGLVLHYIFLAAFAWMAVEGHHLYVKIVKIFDGGRSYTRIYFIIAYGVPFVIVAVTGIVTLCLQDRGYANHDLCWLSTPNYTWAFAGPALLIIALNLVAFIFGVKISITAMEAQKKRTIEKLKTWIATWVSFSALLGVTWVFGILYIQVSPAFAYPFVILNGLQGVLIFLSRIVFNKQARDALGLYIKQKRLLYQFDGILMADRANSGSNTQTTLGSVNSPNTSQSNFSSSIEQSQRKYHRTLSKKFGFKGSASKLGK